MNCARMEECAPSRSEIVSNAKVLWTILPWHRGQSVMPLRPSSLEPCCRLPEGDTEAR